MKKSILGMLAVALFIISANAQETRIKHREYSHGNDRLMNGITLSAGQKEQLKTNWENTKSQLAELDKNEDITVREYKTRKAVILQSQKEQMERVLTSEQKKQLAQNKADRKAKHDSSMSKRFEKMKDRLDLSDDQVVKMNASRKASQAKAKAIRENSQLNHTEKQEQLRVLKEEQKNNFKQLLTPEQMKKMEEMKKERMDRFSRK